MFRPLHGNTPRMETVRHQSDRRLCFRSRRLCFSITKSISGHRVMLKHNLRLPSQVRLSIGVLLMMVLAASWCAAQYPPDNGNGYGNYPMPPAAPGNVYQPSVGGPPMQPPVTSRSSVWPGAAPPTGPGQPTAGNLPPANQLTPCEGTRILAHVGSGSDLGGGRVGARQRFPRSQQGSHSARPDRSDAGRPH